ncbi:Methylthioribose-1-phosphate isomerase [Rubellimicrobium mesophilum DSM 19309]|uniref:Methylthioribose-1-phosphate isomerase n=1 Tax=Rubellimicrobium mesophilum DSM 19309 TaxID=442562 RepID=A0A017HP88_9RHOB|nr:S-methyl-5-thioribose-1-phosphate isomerase [Rubellimicrobium mesophilum]EYD75554.1 Methylthioribose-1-phosphate isomerase [Rubellimicrobium mesophilum DSM 19309]
MKIDGKAFRSIWREDDGSRRGVVKIIDQRWLPHDLRIEPLRDRAAFAVAIRDMWVRGAPLIGATAAYGVAVQMAQDPSDALLDETWDVLHETRPTAINLRWALDDMRTRLRQLPPEERAEAAYARADMICEEDVEMNRKIGEHGLAIIRDIAAQKAPGEPVRILTHCNAGWPATVDWGTATSPIYQAVAAGIPVHVFVDETRPRNQGAQLTAWELNSHGVPHDLIVDNAGGHLMQHGEVDMVIVGTDRTTANGDVCNKIGTYLKALAAKANGVPFYVALPSPTIDWTVGDGVREIPIEERSGSEVTHVQGRDAQGRIVTVQVSPDGTGARNPAFDVTPANLVTGLITERGVCEASPDALAAMFPDRAPGR